MLAGLDAERPVAVCRELTKLHEEIVRGTAGELAERYRDEQVRGEVVLVIGPAAAGAADRVAAGTRCAGSSRRAPARARRRGSSPG